MYFSAIQNCRKICKNSCSCPPIVMQISTKPTQYGIILYSRVDKGQKKQWAPAIFSIYSNFTWHKYSLGWSEEKSAWRHTVSMQISLNLHNLYKNTINMNSGNSSVTDITNHIKLKT